MSVQVFEIILTLPVFLLNFVYICVLSHTCYMSRPFLDFIIKFDDVYHTWHGLSYITPICKQWHILY